MPWKLILFILSVVLVTIFIGFNLSLLAVSTS